MEVVELLTRLQCCLQDVMAHFATPPDSSGRKRGLYSFFQSIVACTELTKVDENMLEWINAEIDKFGDQLPSLRQFILSVRMISKFNYFSIGWRKNLGEYAVRSRCVP